MRVGLDIDGVLCVELERSPSSVTAPPYAQAVPLPEGIDLARALVAAGHTVVLHTSRWEEDREVTKTWLEEHEVPFAELHMDKPRCAVYVDDRALRFYADLQMEEVVDAAGS